MTVYRIRYVLLYLLLPLLFHPLAAAENVVIVSNTSELMDTSGPGQPDGLTVLIADGEYTLARQILIDGSRVTYKSISGNPERTILKGQGPSGPVKNILSIKNSRVYIQGLSLGYAAHHAVQIHGENNAHHIFLQNLVFFDTGQQMLKGSFDPKKPDHHTDFGLIENCRFEFTQGFAFQGYTGGIDIHRGENWVVKDNRFLNIHTKDGPLTEGAIHFWHNSKNTRILANTIENCDRGITLGLDGSFHDTAVIKANRIHTIKDTGICLCNAKGIIVENNTIKIDSDYPNAIEYRFKGSYDILICDNEVNKKITARDGGRARILDNKTTASSHF